ncbi:MAG: SDR family oxidoreductase [Acidimicrobiales bacterium]
MVASGRTDHPHGELGPESVMLAGRVAVVTGAAQGIGAATARALARFGADVALVDKLDTVADTGAAVEALGRRAVTVVGDVRDPEVVDATIAAAVNAYGSIDILVNNAGGGFWAPFPDVSAKGEAALIAENFTQVTSCVRAALPHLVEGASIVNVTSIEAHRAGPGFAVYSAMKAAVENLSKTLALELAPRGVRVNCVAPDMIPTPGDAGLAETSGAMTDDAYERTPMARMGSVEDAAAAIVFLAGDLSRFVTGTTLHLDGGNFAASGWRRRSGSGDYTL